MCGCGQLDLHPIAQCSRQVALHLRVRQLCERVQVEAMWRVWVGHHFQDGAGDTPGAVRPAAVLHGLGQSVSQTPIASRLFAQPLSCSHA